MTLMVYDNRGVAKVLDPAATNQIQQTTIKVAPDALRETLDAKLPENTWPDLSTGIAIVDETRSETSQRFWGYLDRERRLPFDPEIRLRLRAAHRAELLQNGGPKWDVFWSVPPHLVGTVLPLQIDWDIGATGGHLAFITPNTKVLIEGLWADLIKSVRPVRFVEGGYFEDWRAEATCPAMFYLDPMNLARSLKLFFGFRAPARQIADVVGSPGFRHSLPQWRSAPGPDRAPPEEGIFLRRFWHPPTMEEQWVPDSHVSFELEPPDNSPSLWSLLIAAMKSEGVGTDHDARRGERLRLDKPMPAEAYAGAGELAWD